MVLKVIHHDGQFGREALERLEELLGIIFSMKMILLIVKSLMIESLLVIIPLIFMIQKEQEKQILGIFLMVSGIQSLIVP